MAVAPTSFCWLVRAYSDWLETIQIGAFQAGWLFSYTGLCFDCIYLHRINIGHHVAVFVLCFV